ncbi:siderophore-interacting protein [Actinoallomurus acaciae]|uniref:Siderophore-interacting protein n=1 Tax=Actinoallomurus acaciae TaxID=502577 RepID=A0ABV5YZV8_9ACTN
MARTNIRSTRVKPASGGLLVLNVLRRERISANFARVTLGRGDIDRFKPMGYDQWFRLFLPVGGGSLAKVPKRLDMVSYLRFLTVSKNVRPVLRNYSVRAYRPDGPEGPELDVDVVLHGSPDDGTAGPASAWAQTCRPEDPVAILDEGIGFNPPPGTRHVVLVADETGLPAVAGILDSLPHDARGHAIVEIPDEADRQELTGPPGVTVDWLPRATTGLPAGQFAYREAIGLRLPQEPTYGWVVGEQALATGVRRHWVASGLPKDNIMFCGYWRAQP